MALKTNKKLPTCDWLDFTIAINQWLLCASNFSSFGTRIPVSVTPYWPHTGPPLYVGCVWEAEGFSRWLHRLKETVLEALLKALHPRSLIHTQAWLTWWDSLSWWWNGRWLLETLEGWCECILHVGGIWIIEDQKLECDRRASEMAPNVFYVLPFTPLCNLLPLVWAETVTCS